MISAVTGTAATGAPIAGRTVSLKDSRGQSLTQTTAADGTFAFTTSELSPPFLLQVSAPSGTVLHSITATASSTATVTANLTPYTDALVRLYFGLQQTRAETAFADPTKVPMPTRRQLRSVAEALQRSAQLAIARHGAPVVDALDILEKPFSADGSGMDRLLANSRYVVPSPSLGPLELTIAMDTDSTHLSLYPFFSTSTLYVEGQTQSAGTRVDTFRTFNNIPTSTAALAAQDKIDALVASLAAAANASPTVESLEPLFAPDALYAGRDRRAYLTDLAADLAQRPGLSLSVRRIGPGDPTVRGRAELELRAASSLPGASQLRQEFFNVEQVTGGGWRFTGDGSIADLRVTSETRINQVRGAACNDLPTYCDENGTGTYLDVRAPLQLLASVDATSDSPKWAVTLAKSGSPQQASAGVFLDVFQAKPQAQDSITSTSPLLLENVNLHRADGTNATYSVQRFAITTDQVRFTNVETSCSAQPGDAPQLQRCTVAEDKPQALTWTLPTRFAISSVRLFAVKHAFADSTDAKGKPVSVESQCELEGPLLPVTATSAQITVPAGGCFGGTGWRSVDFTLVVRGMNGERSVAIARYGRYQP